MLFTSPRIRLIGNDGLPVAGGKAYFYEANSTTPLTVFSDYDYQTAHAIPVVADAYGLLDPIYIAPRSGGYKMLLTDANDVPLWPADDDIPSPGLGDVPIGGIIPFQGIVGDIPSNYALCDGTGCTPDLRDRFVVGAGTTYALNATGGAVGALTSSSGGAHTHTVDGTAITEAQMPAHGHRIWAVNTTGTGSQWDGLATNSALVGDNDASPQAYVTQNSTANAYIEDTGSGDTHTHTTQASATHTHTVTTSLPPYYGLYYIRRMT